MPTCDIVIRTWKEDLCWLEYCLAFLKKNWQEPGRIIVIANSDCRERCKYWSGPGEFVYVDPWPDTHEFKCYCSLMSPELSQADLIINIDSDTMLVTKSSLSDFMDGGAPVINYQNHADLGDYLGIKLWSPLSQHWLGVAPIRTYMVQPPFVFWRSTIQAVRSQVEKVSGQNLRDALYSEQPFHFQKFIEHPKKFPDWEVIGFYAELHDAARYSFNDFTRNRVPSRVNYYHSWTQWNAQTVLEMDKLLMS